MRNLLVAQSGGPTAAINATVAGVLTAASLSGEVDQVLGAVNGIKGVLEERFVNLSDVMNNTGGSGSSLPDTRGGTGILPLQAQ